MLQCFVTIIWTNHDFADVRIVPISEGEGTFDTYLQREGGGATTLLLLLVLVSFITHLPLEFKQASDSIMQDFSSG